MYHGTATLTICESKATLAWQIFRQTFVTYSVKTEDETSGRARTASMFVDMCYANLDSDNDGKLTYDEFKKIYVMEPHILECFQFEHAAEAGTLTSEGMKLLLLLTATDIRTISLATPSELKQQAPVDEQTVAPEWEPDKAVSRCPECSAVFVFPIKRRVSKRLTILLKTL